MSSEQSTASSPLATDHLFDALAHEYRRAVLSCLRDQDGPVPFADVVEHVSMAIEPAGGIQNGQLHERIKVQLYHSHLPKLEDAGLIEYDMSECSMIEATDAATDLDAPLTDSTPGDEH